VSDKFPPGLSPDAQRARQNEKDKVTLVWASNRGVATQPATFPEVSRAPQKSRKNIKR